MMQRHRHKVGWERLQKQTMTKDEALCRVYIVVYELEQARRVKTVNVPKGSKTLAGLDRRFSANGR